MPEHLFAKVFGKSGGRRLVLTPLLLLLAIGCHRDDVKVYQTTKETDQTPGPTAPAQPTDSPNPALPPGHPDISSMPGMPVSATPGTGSAQLTWKTPASWTELAPGQMRVGSFKVTGAGGKLADVSIIPLGGIAGGNVANVNRWRGQLQLPPVAELAGAVDTLEANGLHLLVFDAANGGSRILGAIVPRPGETWFFKLTGPDDLVARTKPAFLDFLKTVKAP